MNLCFSNIASYSWGAKYASRIDGLSNFWIIWILLLFQSKNDKMPNVIFSNMFLAISVV